MPEHEIAHKWSACQTRIQLKLPCFSAKDAAATLMKKFTRPNWQTRNSVSIGHFGTVPKWHKCAARLRNIVFITDDFPQERSNPARGAMDDLVAQRRQRLAEDLAHAVASSRGREVARTRSGGRAERAGAVAASRLGMNAGYTRSMYLLNTFSSISWRPLALGVTSPLSSMYFSSSANPIFPLSIFAPTPSSQLA